MKDANTWRGELISEIRTIANPEKLARLWYGKDGLEISSFSEEVAHVFDDYDIDGFLAQDLALSQLNEAQHVALQDFRDRFSDFIDRLGNRNVSAIDPKEILDNPGWSLVVEKARRFLQLIDA